MSVSVKILGVGGQYDPPTPGRVNAVLAPLVERWQTLGLVCYLKMIPNGSIFSPTKVNYI